MAGWMEQPQPPDCLLLRAGTRPGPRAGQTAALLSHSAQSQPGGKCLPADCTAACVWCCKVILGSPRRSGPQVLQGKPGLWQPLGQRPGGGMGSVLKACPRPPQRGGRHSAPHPPFRDVCVHRCAWAWVHGCYVVHTCVPVCMVRVCVCCRRAASNTSSLPTERGFLAAR